MRATEAVGSVRAEIMHKTTKRNDNTLEVGCIASTHARLLCRGVDADENEIGLLDRSVYVGRKEEVAATCLLDDLDKTRFVNGQLIVAAVPRINPSLVEVNDRDFDVWTLECNDSARRPA
jgi:hypothetical protein